MKFSKLIETSFWKLISLMFSKRGAGVLSVLLLLIVLLMLRGAGDEGGNTSNDWISISKVEQKGDGLTYLKGSSKPFSGHVLEKYDDGANESLVVYEKGMAHGMSVLWWPNGRKSAEISFNKGEITSKKRWDVNGNYIE
ncbi:MAG: hypothetical protein CMO72_03190 [Verrucomicrobiales bacterium]|nr:hypothetical protein [Verrucomicrobiales bacterium]